MKPPENTTKRLKEEAKKLTDRIFSHKYCVVHYKNSRKFVSYNIEKHHLIHRSNSIRFKFNIWNILPVCDNKHNSAHEAEDKFLAWVKDNLPLHWAWYQGHRHEKARHISYAEWSDICEELRYYLNHPGEAEKIIYER